MTVEAGDRSADKVLELRDLCVDTPGGSPIVEGVSLTVGRGEVLGIVGESGSGKTTTALALLGYTQGGTRISSGSVRVGGQQLDLRDEGLARKLRGRYISYVPQHPGLALNPSLRIRDAVGDVARAHGPGSDRLAAVRRSLARVGLPDTKEFERRFAHQLSGGQQQRICIAMALVAGAPVVILDEPTTGLDVISQDVILEELLRLCRVQGVSLVYVTHDLAVVARIADRIAVMYAGRVVEDGPACDVLRLPHHPYTRGLLASTPDHLRPRALTPMPGVAVGVGERPVGCAFAPRCPLQTTICGEAMPSLDLVAKAHEVRCVHSDDVIALPSAPASASAPIELVNQSQVTVLSVQGLCAEHRGRDHLHVAARDISFEVQAGRCLALVGESGSGKTTIARTIVGLHPLASGAIRLHGELLVGPARRRTREQRRRIQIVFQNPSDALNPRQSVRDGIARAAIVLRALSRRAADGEVARLLDEVRLPRKTADRYPGELSGGERQRVAIARALAVQPEVLLCDEITSALDVSVQAAILAMLDDLRERLGLGVLFITHNLGVVSAVAHEVLVLEGGEICERGDVRTLLTSPRADYTARLVNAAPSIGGALTQFDPEVRKQVHSSGGPVAATNALGGARDGDV